MQPPAFIIVLKYVEIKTFIHFTLIKTIRVTTFVIFYHNTHKNAQSHKGAFLLVGVKNDKQRSDPLISDLKFPFVLLTFAQKPLF